MGVGISGQVFRFKSLLNNQNHAIKFVQDLDSQFIESILNQLKKMNNFRQHKNIAKILNLYHFDFQNELE